MPRKTTKNKASSASRRVEDRRVVTVGDLVCHAPLGLAPVFGRNGLRREVRDARVLRPGQAGWPTEGRGRVLAMGARALDLLVSEKAAKTFCAIQPAAVVVPSGKALPRALSQAARQSGIALLRADRPLAAAAAAVGARLREEVALEKTVHGVLMEISGVGVLILGPSGIGKSECALDLVMRGHRLIGDDLIVVRRMGGDRVMGEGVAEAGSHMEIRGLGIINIQDLFGVAAVLKCKTLELVVDLREWDTLKHYDRLGLDEDFYDLLGIRLPYLRIPVSHGRNMAVILEVATRNYLLKKQGCFTARDFDRNLKARLRAGAGARDGQERKKR